MISVSAVLYSTSLILILLGLYGVLTRKNLVRVVISLDVMDLGVNIFLGTIGYIRDGRAPIYLADVPASLADQASRMVDPLPQALVLTAIVIGFGVTAVALTLIMRLYERKGTVMVSDLRGLKW
jgi:multicomponent Na+:H+ antiporter subunit C